MYIESQQTKYKENTENGKSYDENEENTLGKKNMMEKRKHREEMGNKF